MIAQHGLKAENCLMAGDRIGDLQTALNAGITPILVKSASDLTSEEKEFVQQHRIAIKKDLPELVRNLK